MEDDNYDEFGNYIGPELQSSDSEEEQQQIVTGGEAEDQQLKMVDEDEEDYYTKGQEVVLHEDKQYYPEAEKVFGKGVEALVMDEDAQPLSKPVIEPPKEFKFHATVKEVPETKFDWDYYAGLQTCPRLIRNVVVCGALHHGKTTFCDLLVQSGHLQPTPPAYTSIRADEASRQMSLKCSPFSLILPTSEGKSYLCNFVDTPGHPNFWDEVAAAIRLCDGAMLVVDALEGLTQYGKFLIKEILRAKLELVVVINKVDRLVLELKLPPQDAFFKIRHTLDEVNLAMEEARVTGREIKQINPVNGNVILASAEFHTCFTLQSFADKYKDLMAPPLSTSYQRHSIDMRMLSFDSKKFASFLWGDIYVDSETRKFTRDGKGGKPRSFVHYILEPFYKVVSTTISNEKQELALVLKKLGIFLNKKDYLLDIKPLLKLVLSRLFGDTSCIVDCLSSHIPDAHSFTSTKVSLHYRNSSDDPDIAASLSKCSPSGPLLLHVSKLLDSGTGDFLALGRVISGVAEVGASVKVLGEGFTLEEEEDCVVKAIKGLWVPECRYKVGVQKAFPGNLVLVEGIDESIQKTATVVAAEEEKLDVFRGLEFGNAEAVVKVACEPLNPSELPKMLEGLRKINKSYPMVKTKVEQSGEHVVLGTGELYLDSVFHDLRVLYADIEIKVSEPFVTFSETVLDSSSILCSVESANKRNKLSMVAEPLDKGMASVLKSSTLTPELLTRDFGWDELAANSVWAFTPYSSNMLLDYTLASDEGRVDLVRESVVQGFKWAAREGPLCEEEIKNVKFKLVRGQLAQEPIQRGGSQIIPAARRVCYSSVLLAQPRIMEPYFIAEIACPQDCIEAIYNVLIRRRAHVTSEEPKPGSPLTILIVELPAIESFGFETDLRTHTLGQAMVLQQFSHWSIAPGDPLDKSITLRPLEPSPVPHLAREFLVKTRRRKGLLEDVSVQKFFDSQEMIEMAKQDPQLHAYF